MAKSKGVTIYKLYDDEELPEIEEKICERFPSMSKIVNESAIRRELGEEELNIVDLNEVKGYIFKGFNKFLKEIKQK